MTNVIPPLPTAIPSPTQDVAIPDIAGETVEALAKSAAPHAIKALHAIAHNPGTKETARVAALNAILDRAEGKVGIKEGTQTNFITIINQINRARGKVIDV